MMPLKTNNKRVEDLAAAVQVHIDALEQENRQLKESLMREARYATGGYTCWWGNGVSRVLGLTPDNTRYMLSVRSVEKTPFGLEIEVAIPSLVDTAKADARIAELEARNMVQGRELRMLETSLATKCADYKELSAKWQRQKDTILRYQGLVPSLWRAGGKQTGVYKPGDTVMHTSQAFVAGIGRVVKRPCGPDYAKYGTSRPGERLIWVAWPNGSIMGHYAVNLLHA